MKNNVHKSEKYPCYCQESNFFVTFTSSFVKNVLFFLTFISIRMDAIYRRSGILLPASREARQMSSSPPLEGWRAKRDGVVATKRKNGIYGALLQCH
jgi:hypothetical protein